MRNNPVFILLVIPALLWIGAQSWRRKKVRRAARDLPTRMHRLLGPEPDFAVPEDPPEEMEGFVAEQARARRIEWGVRGIALLWLAYVLYLLLQKGLTP